MGSATKTRPSTRRSQGKESAGKLARWRGALDAVANASQAVASVASAYALRFESDRRCRNLEPAAVDAHSRETSPYRAWPASGGRMFSDSCTVRKKTVVVCRAGRRISHRVDVKFISTRFW